MKRLFLIALAAVLLAGTLAVDGGFAKLGQAAAKPSIVRVLDDTPVYSEDGKKVYGKAATDAVFLEAKTENGRVYMTWGGKRAFIKEASVVHYSEVDWDLTPFTEEKRRESKGKITVVSDEVPVFAEDGQALVFLHEGVQLDYVALRDGRYEVVIGGQSGFIDAVHALENGAKGKGKAPVKLKPSAEADEYFLFQSSTQTKEKTTYFRAAKDNVIVYDNSARDENGKVKLTPIGTLVQGQEYPRVRDYGNWHEIKFGLGYGYVRKSETEPSSGGSIKNQVRGNKSVVGFLKAKENDVAVYDNTGKKLVPFAYLQKGVELPYRGKGKWLEIEIADRYGYVRQTEVTLTKPVARDVVQPKRTYSYDDMVQDIRILQMMYPGLIQTQVIGQSVDGRNLYAVKLGKGKTEIALNGSHHAREHLTTNLLMEMIDQYAYAYANKKKIDGFHVKQVLDRTSIWFVPMVNPDGVMLVQKGHTTAKNPNAVLKLNGGNQNFRAWKANVRGVDLNRQYPGDWDKIQGGPKKPGPWSYKGPKPLSEPEAKALYDFTRKRKFKTVVAYHSSGEAIYWYFRQTGSRYNRDLGIAKMISRKTGYSLIPAQPRPSGGGYKDWFVLSQKKPGFTIEVSPYVHQQPVPLKYWDRIWRQNHSIGLMLADEAYKNRNKR